MRRIDHPCKHVLSVHCLYVPGFCLHGVELREYGVIHMRYLTNVHRLLNNLAFCRKRGVARDLKRGGRYGASIKSSSLVPDPDAYQLGREVHAAVVGQQGSYSVFFRYMERRIEVIPQVLACDPLYVPGCASRALSRHSSACLPVRDCAAGPEDALYPFRKGGEKYLVRPWSPYRCGSVVFERAGDVLHTGNERQPRSR